MLNYYNIDGSICCTPADLPFEQASPADWKDGSLVYLVNNPGLDANRAAWKVTDLRTLTAHEDVSWLNGNALHAVERGVLDDVTAEASEAGKLRAVNMAHPAWRTLLQGGFGGKKPEKKLRVHLLALGDVGSTLLLGLRLLGADVIESIGICDISEKAAARWEFEINQIAYPWDYDALPQVDVVAAEDLMNCDAFIFVASKGIPPVGSGVKDVRMAQYENNKAIVSHYARQARAAGFKGLFCVVSDPVDALARAAWLASNKDDEGNFDGQGLLPEQVQGFGLGVMNARAAYYAKRDKERFGDFLTEGRAYGPHGQDLVIANSIAKYDDERSRALTKLAVTANMEMRALGYKPYVAPALSSGAISILLTLRGEWHYGAVYFGGIYMGCRTRYTPAGLETETVDMPEALFDRIRAAEAGLAALK